MMNLTAVNVDYDMKPRTVMQKTVAELSETLPPLSSYQRKQAIKQIPPHIAKHNSKNEYVCLDCGHRWNGVRASSVICPHCGGKLTVDTSRQWNYRNRDYFAIITKRGGFQVVRMFLIDTSLRKGEPAQHWFGEAFQRWITPQGDNIIIARRRHMMSRYCDAFDYSSEMTIKMEIPGHMVCPYKVIGRVSVIPELIRNGFDGDFHEVNPYRLFSTLLKNNKIETLWKMEQYELARQFIKDNFYRLDEFWPSVKIALRHHYMVRDANMWLDYLYTLNRMAMDIRNPQIIFPNDLVQAHDEWRARLDTRQRREAAIREQERRLYQSGQYFESKLYREDEKEYRKLKSKFFDLSFSNDEITITPLMSVKEFSDEGNLMHHCVFSMKYFKKEEALIFHAVVNGKSVATIELNLKTLEVVQCRGPHNSKPELYDKILELIEMNKGKIASRISA